MKEDGKGGLAPGLVFDGKAETIGLGHPLCPAQKNLALVLSFGNQHAVQADVIHDDPVREVLDGKGDQILVAVTLNS